MNYQNVKEKLESMSEEGYREFSSKLIPGEEAILGVRLPKLRELAKEIAKDDWMGYLSAAQDESHEEIMLQGLVIGFAKATPQEILKLIAQFVPKINNWAICDCFCSGLKIAKKQPQLLWDFIQPYLSSNKEFELRFGVIMMLSHYINDEYISKVLSILDNVRHEGYYVKMGVAWAISVCYVKYPDLTMAVLEKSTMDDFTYRKSLQKILESYRVSQEAKAVIRTMRRK